MGAAMGQQGSSMQYSAFGGSSTATPYNRYVPYDVNAPPQPLHHQQHQQNIQQQQQPVHLQQQPVHLQQQPVHLQQQVPQQNTLPSPPPLTHQSSFNATMQPPPPMNLPPALFSNNNNNNQQQQQQLPSPRGQRPVPSFSSSSSASSSSSSSSNLTASSGGPPLPFPQPSLSRAPSELLVSPSSPLVPPSPSNAAAGAASSSSSSSTLTPAALPSSFGHFLNPSVVQTTANSMMGAAAPLSRHSFSSAHPLETVDLGEQEQVSPPPPHNSLDNCDAVDIILPNSSSVL